MMTEMLGLITFYVCTKKERERTRKNKFTNFRRTHNIKTKDKIKLMKTIIAHCVKYLGCVFNY